MAQILADKITLRVNNTKVVLNQNFGWSLLAEAEEACTLFLHENRFTLLTKEDIEEILVKRKIISETWQRDLVQAYSQQTLYQEAIYNARNNTVELKRARNRLKSLRSNIYSLMEAMAPYTGFSTEYLAENFKLRYMIARSVNKKLSYRFIDMIFREYISRQPREKDIRGFCRSETWRALWGAKKGASIKCLPFTPVQQQLVQFSKMYDGIHKSMDPPEQRVINDDDMLDGWISIKNKEDSDKSSSSRTTSKAEQHSNVFYFTKDKAEAQEIINSNPINVIESQYKEQRQIAKGGTVKKYAR